MSQTRTTAAIARRTSVVENLEHRRLLSLVVDLRLAGGGTSAVVSTIGQVVNVEAWATVTGNDANSNNEGMQDIFGSFVSSNSLGGAALGTLKVTLASPFNGAGSTAGTQRDLDGDGDLDVGNLTPGASTTAGIFVARSNAMTTTGGTAFPGGQAFKFADLTFTVTSLVSGNGASSDVKFVPRADAGNNINAVWQEDGTAIGQGGGNNGDFRAGSSVALRQNIGQITGKVFNDKNANSEFDGKDTRIKGVQLYADIDGSGTLNAGDISVRSTGSGLYRIPNLQAGTYKVRVNAATVPVGFRRTRPNGPAYTVTLGVGASVTGRNWGYTPRTLITGQVFNDVNGNRTKDSGEGIWAGWRVFADVNGDGLFSKKTDRGVLTDANGNFSLGTMPAGTWSIRASVPAGHSLTTPTSGRIVLTLSSGEISTGSVFGIQKIA